MIRDLHTKLWRLLLVLMAVAVVFVMVKLHISNAGIRKTDESRKSATVASHENNNAALDTELVFSDIEKAQIESTMNWTLAIINPTQDVFRNELNFRNIQTNLACRHIESERAYNIGGYQSMLTFKITGTDGTPLAGVSVDVIPSLNWSRFSLQQYITDSSGTIVVKDKSANKYHIHASKTGYYDWDGDVQFFSHHYICVDGKKWIPWNPHVEFVLKPKLKPVCLNEFKSWENPHRFFPLKQDIPFDFLSFDFLPPFGLGKCTNAIIHVDHINEPNVEYGSTTTLSFPNGGGIRKETVDGFCQYIFPREIEEGGFQSKLTLEKRYSKETGICITGGAVLEKEFFSIKVPVIGKNGESNYCYGVLLQGPIGEFGNESADEASLFMECYMNPEPGNRIVESTELRKK